MEVEICLKVSAGLSVRDFSLVCSCRCSRIIIGVVCKQISGKAVIQDFGKPSLLRFLSPLSVV